MFSVKDLESYVCKSSSALQLKFGKHNIPFFSITANKHKEIHVQLHVHPFVVCRPLTKLYIFIQHKIDVCMNAQHVSVSLAFMYTYIIVRSQADVLDNSLTFAPVYTHQVFGEKEVIFGYKNLKIKVQA